MAVLAPSDWKLYPTTRDNAMDITTNNSRQRSSPASDSNNQATTSSQHQHQHLQQQQQQQPILQQQQVPAAFPYPLQQQPQGSWTPSIAAQPFYPSFYQNIPQQQSPQHFAAQIPQPPPYFDPANAQLAQWAYQQMMFNAQQGFAHLQPHHLPPQQRNGSNTSPTNDYFAQNQKPSPFNSFPSGTPPPPPHHHRSGNLDHAQQQSQQQNGQYSGFHPYRRPNRQPSHTPDGNEWRPGPQPPYARPDASGSTSSINSSSSQRQRTNSNQSGNSGQNVPAAIGSTRSRNGSPGVPGPSPPRGSPASGPSSTSSSPAPPSLRGSPHNRNGSSSSSSSAATGRPSVLPPTLSPPTTTSSSPITSSSISTPLPRPARPSPLSQGNFTASEKRMSRDDSDLPSMRDPTPSASMIRSGGLKGRLRRALSFNAAQTLQEEEVDDDESIKASALNNNNSNNGGGGAGAGGIGAAAGSSKLKPKMPLVIKPSAGSSPAGSGSGSLARSPDGGVDDGASTATVQTKKKGRAASLFNSRLNASTDNISLSSTVSSASVMIRKLGSMGRLARRNSLAGITSLFKDKDKNKDKDGEGGAGEGGAAGKDKDKKGKKKDKDKKTSGAKAEASEASVSHVTAELDRSSSGGDWSVGADMNGLSPAAKLARQHTLKSNAEAAARAKAQLEASASASAKAAANGVPTWERNTATRQAAASPLKGGGGVRVNEDGTRVLVEDDEDEEDEHSSDGHYGPQHAGQTFHADGWDDDEDWEGGEEAEADEDVTIRVGIDKMGVEEDDANYGLGYQEEPEPWAVDLRRSVEKTRKPAKGILKHAGSYDQQSHLEHPNTNRARSNSYNSHPGQTSELGPLARIPSPDPDHIDGLHRHPSHSSTHGAQHAATPPSIPPLSFESSSSPIRVSLETLREPGTPTSATHGQNPLGPHPPERTSSMFNLSNSSAPALTTITNTAVAATLTHRSATAPTSKRLAFASNLSVYDTFSSSVYDRRSEPATWSRLTPALAQRIKEELNSYKMEEMEVHAASRIHTQFFV